VAFDSRRPPVPLIDVDQLSISYRILVVKVLTENKRGENKTRKPQMILSSWRRL